MQPTINPLHPNFVAEIAGVNLAEPMTMLTASSIQRAFRRYAVLIFRDQSIFEYSQLAPVSGIFGTSGACDDITNLDADDQIMDKSSLETRYRLGNMLWHMDMLVLDRPPLAALLFARELPSTGGGQTQFADVANAYSDLSKTEKRTLRKLVAVHSLETLRQKAGIFDPEEFKSDYAPKEHPLVCIDPYSKRQTVLFSAHTSHIKGMKEEGSQAILDKLLSAATGEEHVYTHHWRMNDLVLWANWRSLHRVLPYEHGSTRQRLWRSEILSNKSPRKVKLHQTLPFLHSY